MTVTSDPTTAQWTDHKRYLWLLGLLVPLFPFMGWGLYELTGLGVFWFIGPIMILGIIPAIDLVAGLDRSNPPDDMITMLEADRYYRWVTYIFLPVQYLALVWACWMWAYSDITIVDKVGLALTVGMVAGVGINTAHELGHKKEKVERWLAKIALAQSFYGHFYIEHNRGHHVRVATPEDPASARFGETFWEFLPRTVFGGLRSAWQLETARLRRLDKGPWRLSNDVLNAWLISVVLWGVLIAVFGPALIPFVVIQAVYGFSLLESVNYIEHYGLLRQTRANGRYERCTAEHSWNSDHLVTNLFLYHLQRHSDHHANPTRRYQTLRSMAGAPNLPSGYASLIGLTYFPPLWRRLMDHRVLAHYGGDIARVNISPRRRAKILARYAASEAAAA